MQVSNGLSFENRINFPFLNGVCPVFFWNLEFGIWNFLLLEFSFFGI